MLKEIPDYDRPREKALKYGINTLSNIELLAIILRTGSKEENVINVAKNLLYSFKNLSSIAEATLKELTTIKGIGEIKAITLLASIELGLRIMDIKNEIIFYTNPQQVFDAFYPKVHLLKKEHLYAIFLNTKGMIIQEKLITQGTISMSLLDGKDIIKWALKLSASAIILVHNHPSGDPSPSLADLKATSGFVNQAKVLELVVIDHIIIGNTYYSMKENSKIFRIFNS